MKVILYDKEWLTDGMSRHQAHCVYIPDKKIVFLREFGEKADHIGTKDQNSSYLQDADSAEMALHMGDRHSAGYGLYNIRAVEFDAEGLVRAALTQLQSEQTIRRTIDSILNIPSPEIKAEHQ